MSVGVEWERLKILITVKTYPIPSKKYDELVCTAGVTASGDFIRLYPINFRELPFKQQYRKYQWIEVMAVKHGGPDVRKESYKPDCDSIRILGDPVPSNPGNWSQRAKYVLLKASQSVEDLNDKRETDRTSLGIFRPKRVKGMKISVDTIDWPPKFLEAMKQRRLFEFRERTLLPPRKVPFKFQYQFECDDPRCKGKGLSHNNTIILNYSLV
jgi:hypothetical protein